MRAKFAALLVVIGAAALLLGPNLGLSQPGRGPTSGSPSDGGFSGGSSRFDPMANFERYAQGRGFFHINDVTDSSRRREGLMRYAEQAGIRDGRITREHYQGYYNSVMGSRGSSGGSSGGPSGMFSRGSSSGGGMPSLGGGSSYGGGMSSYGGGSSMYPRGPSGMSSYGGGSSGSMMLSSGGSGGMMMGGRSSSGMMSMMGGDPNAMFDRFAGGRDVLRRSDMDPMRQMMFDRFAGQMGLTGSEISRQQFVGAIQQMQSRMGGSSGDSRGGWSGDSRGGDSRGGSRGDSGDSDERRFRERDRNGDGLLNYDEMSDTLKSERERWDANGDGFIDLNEYKTYMEARSQQRGGGDSNRGGRGGGFDGGPFPSLPPVDQKPVVFRAGNLPRDIPPWFRQWDTDADGQIGLYEWKSSGLSFDVFNTIDRNGDGFATITETMVFAKTPDAAALTMGNGRGRGRDGGGSGGPSRDMMGRGPDSRSGGGPGGSFGMGGRGGFDPRSMSGNSGSSGNGDWRSRMMNGSGGMPWGGRGPDSNSGGDGRGRGPGGPGGPVSGRGR
jgi:hypothetical protein